MKNNVIFLMTDRFQKLKTLFTIEGDQTVMPELFSEF